MVTSLESWGVPMISGGFAILGILVANFAVALGDGRKRRMEDERRWHDKRLEIYFDLLEKFNLLRDKISAATEPESETSLRLDDLDELQPLSEKMRLIATGPVYQAWRECEERLFQLIFEILEVYREALDLLDNRDDQEAALRALRGAEIKAIDLFESLSPEIASAGVKFIEVARKELGVP